MNTKQDEPQIQYQDGDEDVRRCGVCLRADVSIATLVCFDLLPIGVGKDDFF